MLAVSTASAQPAQPADDGDIRDASCAACSNGCPKPARSTYLYSVLAAPLIHISVVAFDNLIRVKKP